jgi:hypothetical protein
LHYTTRFLDGLKPAICSVVAIQRPVDLDTAYLLASLQEEVVDGTTVLNAPPVQQYQYMQQHYLPAPQKQLALPPIPAKDKHIQAPAPAEDKLAALKAYRRAKGLCFTCGERWARDHQCKSSVKLHVIQEMIDFYYAAFEADAHSGEDSDQPVNLMLLSADSGTAEPSFAIQLNCCVHGKKALFLVDSGSTHSFLSQEMAQGIMGRLPLQRHVSVKVAGGGLL